MKINKVVGIGCSFTRHAIEGEEPQRLTYNNELLEEYSVSYISQLAKLLGCTYENLSVGGVGNKHIFRKLFRYIKNTSDITDTLFVIGISFLHRYDFINPHIDDGKFGIPIYTDLRGGFLENRAKLFKMPLEDILNFSRIFFRYIYNDKTAIQELEELITVYSALVQQKNSNIIFVNTVNNELELDGLFTFPNNTQCWREFITSYDTTYKGKHPNHDDHEKLGEVLHTYIAKNLPKNFPGIS